MRTNSPNPVSSTGGGAAIPDKADSKIQTMFKRMSLSRLTRKTSRPIPSAPSNKKLSARDIKLLAKATPYVAKGLNPKLAFNSKVSVATNLESKIVLDEVVCRHFAEKFVTHSNNKRSLIEIFATMKGVHDFFYGTLDDVHKQFLHQLKNISQECKHVVKDEDFGRYMVALASELSVTPESEKPSCVNCHMLTESHAMALYIELKNDSGESYISIKAYDPSATASYMRVEAKRPEDLADLTLSSLLNANAGRKGEELAVMVASTDERVKPKFDQDKAHSSDSAMRIAAKYGVEHELNKALTAVLRDVNEERVVNMLSGLTELNGEVVPFLNRGFRLGNPAMIGLFTQKVLQSNLSDKSKVQLLAAKNTDSTPAMCIGLKKRGITECVQVFMENISNSNLIDAHKHELLKANDKNELSGLMHSVAVGHVGGVESFVRSALNMNLHDTVKMDLVSIFDNRGVSAFSQSSARSKGEVAAAYTRAVQNSPLPEQHKVTLLNNLEAGMGVL